MPTYTIDIIGVTGTAWGTFTSLGVVGTITYSDDDAFGIGDNNIGGGVSTETGALPVITGVTGTLPASWVGQTLAFGWEQQIDGSGNVDALGMVIGGGSNFISTHLVQHPDGAPIIAGNTYTASGIANVDAEVLICFCADTLIKTKHGEKAVQELQVGDQVLTMDNGFQPIRWLGSTKRLAYGSMAPVVFDAGSIGNERELRVSPQHRMLVSDPSVELFFGCNEALATAKSLVNGTTIRQQEGGLVEYFHLLFDKHQIIFSNGSPSESFHPGEQGWSAFDEQTRLEILGLFPELIESGFSSYGQAARRSLRTKEVALLTPLAA